MGLLVSSREDRYNGMQEVVPNSFGTFAANAIGCLEGFCIEDSNFGRTCSGRDIQREICRWRSESFPTSAHELAILSMETL